MAYLGPHSEASGGMRRGGGVGENGYTLRPGPLLLLWSVVGAYDFVGSHIIGEFKA